MVKNFITKKHRVSSPSSVPQPLHMLTEAEKDAYILEQRDRLNDRNFGRTRSSTSRLFPSDTPTTHRYHSYTVNLNAPDRDLPPPPGVHIEDLTSPEPNVLGYYSPTRAIPPESGITYTEFDLRGDPANYSRVIPSDRHSSAETQYELTRIAKCKYHDQERPIGIDQTQYPEYSTLPAPYRPFTHYMHKHGYSVPPDWQNRECPYGFLPLLPDMPNFILGPGPRTTPRLMDTTAFLQLDECNKWCKHDSWPEYLVIAVIDPDTCRGCIEKFTHYHLQNSSDRHDYFRLFKEERTLCFIEYTADAPLPFFPPEMPMTYTNRLGSSSSTSTITIPRATNTRITAAYTPHIPTSTSSVLTITSTPTSDTPVYIKTESLNMMFRAPPESTPNPATFQVQLNELGRVVNAGD